MVKISSLGYRMLLKSLLAITAPVFIILVLHTTSSTTKSQELQACVCQANVTYDSNLPASHPKNRCATERRNVSWIGWLTGENSSSQFHFVDLFELLHKKHANHTDNSLQPKASVMDN